MGQRGCRYIWDKGGAGTYGTKVVQVNIKRDRESEAYFLYA
jgi:hypothetical protein